MERHQIQWCDGKPNVVDTIPELDALLDRIHAQHMGEQPILVSIDGPVGSLMIGLGHSESVLSYVPPDHDPPYLVSTNAAGDESEVDFFFDGHHSPQPAKFLIPMDVARRAVRTFVEHRALLLDVRWGEV